MYISLQPQPLTAGFEGVSFFLLFECTLVAQLLLQPIATALAVYGLLQSS
jgi:hypothetical protein